MLCKIYIYSIACVRNPNIPLHFVQILYISLHVVQNVYILLQTVQNLYITLNVVKSLYILLHVPRNLYIFPCILCKIYMFPCMLFEIYIFPSMQVLIFVAEPEPVEPKLFETWSRSWNYLFNKYLLQSVWRMLGWRKTSIATYGISHGTTVLV